ncbi:exonuclease SbcCD subunit D [Chlorobium sp. BLA1]|uniref:metallophosphoesterase family protein n=1 Tax=Candidatus Chlorobium masyuteum TaxID=2716876 RepID=UPI001421C61F|nr:exonuclease SbcCD subunit D [Candidatus Chlorobium masyuteum]NHQ60461.1 exonuclease SbcCD subunit D [Candidatus Chlorobium masyuteum]
MTIRFIHTADLHLGKTYRTASAGSLRYEDFFVMLDSIVKNAIDEAVDFVLIAGDLFHTGQILPRTFARTIESLQPLKDALIPCIAVEGNHDWIHRRESISWMEALSEMGYIRLLRPSRTESGGYRFEPFKSEEGSGGHIEIKGLHIYGLGYIGTQAGSHVERICESIATTGNILLFHVGIWSYSPVEIGNMKPEEALPLSAIFDYVALGHGHKPYVVERADGHPYAYNPGSPECVNFGEERFDKGYYLVTVDEGIYRHEFRQTYPRPMMVTTINLDGADNADEALRRLSEEIRPKLFRGVDERKLLLELKLTGQVRFHPFELGRERLRLLLDELCHPLHIEIKNHLSLFTREGGQEREQKHLGEIEKEVVRELITARSEFRGREEELLRLALAIRDQVMKGECEGDDLLGMLTAPQNHK